MSVASAVVDRRREVRPWALPGAVTTALVAATIYTVVRDPHQPGFFPSCVFLSTTGFYCPGCGGLRAVHDLLTGHVTQALHMNPVVVLGVLPGGLFLMAWWLAATIFPRVRPPVIPTWLTVAFPVFLGVFWVLRNLPALAPYLSPVGA